MEVMKNKNLKQFKVTKECTGYVDVSLLGMHPNKLVDRLLRKYPPIDIYDQESVKYVVYRRVGETRIVNGKRKVTWSQVKVYDYYEALVAMNKGDEVNE